MSIASISSNSDYYQSYLNKRSSSVRQQSHQDFKELARALQSGSLSDTQQVFSALQQWMPKAIPLNDQLPSVQQSTEETNAISTESSSGTESVEQPSVETSAVNTESTSLTEETESGSQTETESSLSELTDSLKSIGLILILSSALQFFSSLQQLSFNSSGSQHQTAPQYGGENAFATDFSTLGQAIQSGDLSKVQEAYATLQKNILATHPWYYYQNYNTVDATGTGSAAIVADNGAVSGLVDIST